MLSWIALGRGRVRKSRVAPLRREVTHLHHTEVTTVEALRDLSWAVFKETLHGKCLIVLLKFVAVILTGACFFKLYPGEKIDSWVRTVAPAPRAAVAQGSAAMLAPSGSSRSVVPIVGRCCSRCSRAHAA